MPVRTYTGLDLINYLETNSTNKTETDGTVTITPTSTSQAIVSLGVVGGATVAPNNSPDIRAFGSYSIAGNLPYATLFPTIPAGALIQSIAIKMAASFVGAATGTWTAPTQGSVESGARVSMQIGATLLNTLTIEENDAPVGGSGTFNSSISESRTFSTTQTLDFTGSPITRAQLITDYTALLISLFINYPNACITAVSGGGISITASFNLTVSISNFEIQVTYTPPDITLSPSGGNVESGESIEVESPDLDVQVLEYAAITPDAIIPIIPKKNPDGTVTLEVPNPATDPCIDALAACPDCEDCFDACSENLEGEDCQACMQTCLDCLAEEFENLEQAEECNESTHEPPGAVPISIVCGGPPFDDSVPLGTFTILLTVGSGIYRFIPGQTKDVIYSSVRDGTTYDVKIPNPFAKTGFFRS